MEGVRDGEWSSPASVTGTVTDCNPRTHSLQCGRALRRPVQLKLEVPTVELLPLASLEGL